ncbi:HAE1 family hydrophobic/amphiphilic exporter-1 [Neomicrococcus aestuarii]|uniref:HAE1 family hydrophobic/amphiphilic exporter-1 n=1 Tax=Neomicrococcus aestuarii TaxID=556325 RepID=A0A7W8X037_9MICC|nr:efflux RND transporter permease subunit [Neomicrococcus aestuarii]MBB5511324.1 HAE1 family hydrophobic/amphiphilic exporter-1 [Neomicrococcus aestuarii]
MHRLANFSLGNKALIALVSVFISIFGVLAMGGLKQEIIPSLEFPQVAVVTQLPGASPEVVDKQVSEPLESALQAVEGLESSSATSRQGVSTVSLSFVYGTNLDRARSQVDRAISNVRAQLPDDANPQSFSGSVSDFPVVFMAVSSDQDLSELKSDLERLTVPRLTKLEGVRSVDVSGGTEQRISIAPNETELTARGYTTQSITDALSKNAGLFPVGSLNEGKQSLPVQAGTTVNSIEDIQNIPLAANDSVAPAVPVPDPDNPTATPSTPSTPSMESQTTLIKDVADVMLANAPATSITRTNGVETLSLSLTKTPEGDTVRISHAVADLVDELETELGNNATITTVFDQAPFIEKSIKDLTVEGLLGLGFAVIVILVFLMSLRSTIVTAISIPLSLLVTFIGLQAFGFSLNLLTLGALTISIGRVVDDSIVVIENIKRHLEYGEPKGRAILQAVREVATAVTAATLTTVAVFLPVAFVSGIAGELFRPFAITMTIALLGSLFVSLTIVPVLAYWFLGRGKSAKASAEDVQDDDAAREGALLADTGVGVAPGTGKHRAVSSLGSKVSTSRESVVHESEAQSESLPDVNEVHQRERNTWLQRGYLPVLRSTQKRPVITLVTAVLILVGTVAMIPLVPTNLLGSSGENSFRLTQKVQAGSSLAETTRLAKPVESALRGVEGVEDVQLTIGSGGMFAFLGGSTADQANFTVTTAESADQQAIQDAARDAIAAQKPSGEINFSTNQGQGFGSSVSVNVSAPSPELLAEANAAVVKGLEGIEGTKSLESNLTTESPVITIDVDRAKAASYGLTEEAVGGLAASKLSAVPAGSVRFGYTDYPVVITGDKIVNTISELQAVEILTPQGMITLSDVAEVTESQTLSTITSSNGERIVTVSVTPEENALGAVSAEVTKRLETIELPAGTTAEIGGAAVQQANSFRDLGLALIAAVAIVYVIMVATFKSLIQPLILLVSVPFAATGAIGMLLITGVPLGLPSLIGMLMLVGIVVTNAIVLIDLINQYRRPRGALPPMSLDEAIEQGARQRLRPIIMTAAATIFALTPMAMGLTGGGGFISQPLAVVVIGGLISSTLLTLVLVPVLYRMVERLRERRTRAA